MQTDVFKSQMPEWLGFALKYFGKNNNTKEWWG